MRWKIVASCSRNGLEPRPSPANTKTLTTKCRWKISLPPALFCVAAMIPSVRVLKQLAHPDGSTSTSLVALRFQRAHTCAPVQRRLCTPWHLMGALVHIFPHHDAPYIAKQGSWKPCSSKMWITRQCTRLSTKHQTHQHQISFL